MTYQDFKNSKEKLHVANTSIRLDHLGITGVPLHFMYENSNRVFECLDDYSSLHDILDFEYEEDSFKLVFDKKFPKHEPLALASPEEGEEWDCFYEFALFVDTSNQNCPVVYFNAEYRFEEVAPSFEIFYKSLSF